MIKLFVTTLHPPLSHYLLLNNTRKTLVINVQSTSSLERKTTDDLTCISNKMTLFINSKDSTIFIFMTMNKLIKNNIIIQIMYFILIFFITIHTTIIINIHKYIHKNTNIVNAFI